MAIDLPQRQRTVVELLKLNRSALEALDTDQSELLQTVANSFQEGLASQGVPFYAEEAFAALTALEALDSESATDLDELKLSINLFRLAMIQRLQEAWADRDKAFFTE